MLSLLTLSSPSAYPEFPEFMEMMTGGKDDRLEDLKSCARAPAYVGNSPGTGLESPFPACDRQSRVCLGFLGIPDRPATYGLVDDLAYVRTDPDTDYRHLARTVPAAPCYRGLLS